LRPTSMPLPSATAFTVMATACSSSNASPSGRGRRAAKRETAITERWGTGFAAKVVRALSTEHFVVYFHQGEDRLARHLAAIAEETWRTLRQPLGPVGSISPWNLPLYLLSWKVAPALAAGNTVVAKPSEVTPATAHLLGELHSKKRNAGTAAAPHDDRVTARRHDHELPHHRAASRRIRRSLPPR